MSVMEMSHRSPEFESINAGAEQQLRNLLGIPEDYAVIFVQGGGSMQFVMAPMNLGLPGKPVDVLHTGSWTAKAIGELKKGFLHHIAASTEASSVISPTATSLTETPSGSSVVRTRPGERAKTRTSVPARSTTDFPSWKR